MNHYMTTLILIFLKRVLDLVLDTEIYLVKLYDCKYDLFPRNYKYYWIINCYDRYFFKNSNILINVFVIDYKKGSFDVTKTVFVI